MHVDAAGQHIWYEDHGAGPPVLLLHGALADARSFGAMVPALARHLRVLVPERRGHGHTADVPGPITYDLMAADTVAFLEAVVGGPAHLVGHSDGANVALLVALARPDLVDGLVLIGGNTRPDGLVPGAVDLDELVPLVADSYAEVSPDGRDHLPVVAAKLTRMIAEEPDLGPDDLARVSARTLVMSGDDDAITLEHTIALYRGIPDSELAVVPGTSHVLILEKPELCDELILSFLTTAPVPTFLPLRRAVPIDARASVATPSTAAVRPTGTAVLASYLCHDHVGLATFYAAAFGWPPVPAVESEWFTALDSGRVVIGFHHDHAHDLLDIADRRGQAGSRLHLTVDVGSAEQVDAAVGPLTARGARVVKPPFTTYYHARQVVLEDPEGNLFRISSSQVGVSDR